MDKLSEVYLSRPWRLYFISLLLLSGIASVWVYDQYRKDANLARMTAENHFTMVHNALTRMLQDGRFEDIQPYINEWARYHHETQRFLLTAQNGFVQGEYYKSPASEQVLPFNSTINFGYKGEAELLFDFDTSDLQQSIWINSLTVIAALSVLALFGALLVNRTIQLSRLSGQLNKRNDELKSEHSLLQSVIDNLPDLVYFKGVDGRYRGSNRKFRQFHGIDEDDIRDKTDNELFDEDIAEKRTVSDNAVIRSNESVQNNQVLKDAKDKSVFMDTLQTPYFDRQGNLLGMIGIFRDITRLHEYQNKLKKLAYHDALTGLPNRRYLQERMQQDMALARRHHRKLAVCAIDLDGFKPINDHYGHKLGDSVLQALAKRLNLVLRQGDTAARWGGDEFTVLLNGLEPESQDINQILKRIQSAIRTPVEVANIDIQLSSSIGITLYPDDDQDADTLIRHADQAMYVSKQNGKNQYTFFDSDQDRQAHQMVRKITELMGAIANEELRLYYQPQVDLRDGSLHGVEALVRWQNPQHGLMSPGEFLPPLENHEASITLDTWVLETAIQQLLHWQKQQLDCQVSVNLTGTTLEDPMFLIRLSNMLEQHPGIRNRLQIEILESTSLYNLQRVAETVQSCIDLGVKVALDDFGTGFSSLTYLRQIPATTLKIDRSFVMEIHQNQHDLKIVSGILKIAEALDKQVIAEGVETIQHGIALLHLGCDLAQGYAIARPMPADEMIAWWQQYKLPAEWLHQSRLYPVI